MTFRTLLLWALISGFLGVGATFAASSKPVPWGQVISAADRDPHNPLKIQWIKKSPTEWVLDTFYYDDTREFFSSKSVRLNRAPKLRLLNRSRLTFNPKTGVIRLGDRNVGVWHGSLSGFELTARIQIDPFRKTIEILRD